MYTGIMYIEIDHQNKTGIKFEEVWIINNLSVLPSCEWNLKVNMF